MSFIIYLAICIVSIAVVVYVGLFILYFLASLFEYARDEVSSDPVTRLISFLIVILFVAGGVLKYFGI